MNKPENTETPISLPEKQPDDARSGDSIVISQATIYYFVIAILFFAAGFVVSWILFTTTTGSTVSALKGDVLNAAQSAVSTAIAQMPAGSGVAAAVQATETPVPRQNVAVGAGPSWGPADAKVTLIEFSDFQCPYCENFFQYTYPLIKKNYGDKIHFVYRYFPLTQIHPQAEQAALAAACANDQGKFWQYHDQLFSNQQDLSLTALVKYATATGVTDNKAFQDCLNSKKYESLIQEDFNAGMGYFVSGTPTFFINGNMLVGAQPYAVFQKALDQELAAAGA